MATLNDFSYVDDSDEVVAEVVNKLLGSILRSEYKNVETLAADRQLTDADTPIQRFDLDGADRPVFMPEGDAVDNHLFLLVNASNGGEVMTVRDYADTETLATLLEGEWGLFLPDGNGEYFVTGRMRTNVISPAQITGNQNNYNPTGNYTADVLRLSSDAARSITGLAGGSAVRLKALMNVGSHTITLENEDAGSSAANRFSNGADFALESGKTAFLLYDPTSSYWRVVGGGGGGAGVETIVAGDGVGVDDTDPANPVVSVPTGLFYNYTSGNDIFRCDSPGGSSVFSGTINGTPSGMSVVYNAGFTGREEALVPTSTSQLGKLRLYNTTRGNYALISNNNVGTNTITLKDNAPLNWANGDTITIASQTVSGGGGNWFDIEIVESAIMNKAGYMVSMTLNSATAATHNMWIHPTETFGVGKIIAKNQNVANIADGLAPPIKLVSNLISCHWEGAITFARLRILGYFS